MTEQGVVLTLTVSSCLLTGVLGLAVLRTVRHRRVVVVLGLAGLVPVLAVAVSVLVNVRAMFISPHDSRVVVTALAAALLTAAVIAVMVARWLVAGSRAVGHGLRGLGATEGPADAWAVGPVGPADQIGAAGSGRRAPVPAELAALGDELRETSRRLEASRRRERDLEGSRRELIAFLSHDLRSPLSGLRALAEGIEDGVVDDVPRALERMRTTVDRMNGMVDDLFELSRLQAPDAARATVVLDLREVAEDITDEHGDRARTLGVRLELAPGDGLAVRGVADELARAVSNLIGNAVRHTRSGGQVLVHGVTGDDGRVRLSVSDGCGGIDPDQLDRVFDTGWRADAERTPGDSRTGLGLAIARGVAQAHDGTLEVQNTADGCRFELTLPPVLEDTPQARAGTDRLRRTSSGSVRDR